MRHALSGHRAVAAMAAMTCAVAFCASAETRVEHRIVARRGDPAPGVAGKTFASLSSDGPLISAGGHVAFFANSASSSGTAGIWAGRPGEVGLVAHEPAQAAGLSAGITYNDLRAISSIDASGRVGFWGYTEGGSSSGKWTAFWGGPAAAELLMRKGSEVPWVSPGIFASDYLQPPLLGGGTAVLSTSTTASNSNGTVGIWQTTLSGLQLIMRQGASAPGMPVGAVFYGTGLPSRPLVNGSGDVAFWAQVTGGGVDYLTNDRGIWIRSNGVLSLAFRGNAPVSGFGTGVTLIYPDLRAFANDGSIAFFGDLKFNNGQNNQSALWWGKPGDYRLVARLNAQAAGAPSGVVHNSFTFTRPMLAGEFIGYSSSLSGTGVTSANNVAFFVGRRDDAKIAVREGDQVPGMAAGVVFADLTDRFAMNARGQIVFRATIAGPGITTANDEGIWATDSRGHIVQVARQGTPIAAITADGVSVSLPVVRLSILADSGGEDGTPTSINAAGQVAFYVYTDPAQASSQAAIIRADIIEPCVADFNEDGFLDFADFDDFVGAFEGGLATSDINADGFLTFDDFDAFVAAFEAGC